MAISDILYTLKKLIGRKPVFTPAENIYDIAANTSSAEIKDHEYNDRCVMVGVLRNRRQLEILLREGFYHIPVEQASDCSFPIKYIAIYQSKRFFGKDAGIRYYGEVESCVTVKRSKIREIPKKSNEKYFYFKVKNWKCLEKPIEAKEMESVAISTTPYLLKSCDDSAQLTLRSKEEHLFYKKLIGQVKKLVLNRIPDGGELVYKDFTVKLKGGVLCLYFGDVIEYAIGYDCFLECPQNVIRDIFDYYPEL